MTKKDFDTIIDYLYEAGRYFSKALNTLERVIQQAVLNYAEFRGYNDLAAQIREQSQFKLI